MGSSPALTPAIKDGDRPISRDIIQEMDRIKRFLREAENPAISSTSRELYRDTALDALRRLEAEGHIVAVDKSKEKDPDMATTGQTLSEIKGKPPKVAFTETAEVVREGKQIILPNGMSIEQGIATLERRKAYENEVTNFTEMIEAYPWDGAHALGLALAERYGWASAEPIPTMFGEQKPDIISVPNGVNSTVNIAWGRFSIPGIKGWVQTSATVAKGKLVFVIAAEVQRKYEGEVKAIAELTRRFVRERSLYRGKSIKVAFNNGFNSMPEFLDVSSAVEERLVFSDDVRTAIQINLFTPIEDYHKLKAAKIPFKRGILLAGKYGTGKTETAFTAANKANAQGITFIYVQSAHEFPSAVQFAKAYSPAVVFCEDIDRVTSGERDGHMDNILNTVDGIEAKVSEVMAVLTTNEIQNIHRGMIRPGRIDAVIEVFPPDAKAVESLIRLYGRGLVDTTADLSVVGKMLDGQIPATVREAVERSKLAALRRTRDGVSLTVQAEDLETAVVSMGTQLRLLNSVDKVEPGDFEKAMGLIGQAITNGIKVLHLTEEQGGTEGGYVGYYDGKDFNDTVVAADMGKTRQAIRKATSQS